MRHLPSIRRHAACLLLLVAVTGATLTVVTAPPAAAVPVDGDYSGRLVNGLASYSTARVRLDTSGPTRSAVTATVFIDPGVSIPCAGQTVSLATGPAGLTLFGSGGVRSVAAAQPASLELDGVLATAGLNIPISFDGVVSAGRDQLAGTAIVSLPFGCGDTALNLYVRSDEPYRIRTGHDGLSINGVDITHMIDKGSATGEGGLRCMFLWASPPAGSSAPDHAIWSVEAGAPPGAHIRAGWAYGTPPPEPGWESPDPWVSQVCITDATPEDTTFTVAVKTSGVVVGRVLLWVGPNRPYPARAQGDVHHLTFDETAYDFQAVGEYVDAVAGDGKDFAVQSRLEPVPGHPVTVTTAVAARVNGDRVAVYLGASGRPAWYLDGAPLSVPARLPSGGRITSPSPDRWTVSWPRSTEDPGATTGTTMQLSFGRWSFKDHLNVDELLLGPGLAHGQVRGLLGSADGEPSNDLTPSAGGAPVSPAIDPARPPYEQPLYADFGRSWLVTRSSTLFDYLDPGHPDPASYEDAKAPVEMPKVVDEGASAACREVGVTRWPQLDFCTYDVGITGARDIAPNYLDAPRRR